MKSSAPGHIGIDPDMNKRMSLKKMSESGDSFKLSQLRRGCCGDIIQKSWQTSHKALDTSSPAENPQCHGTKNWTPAFASNYDLELSLCTCEPLYS